MDLSLLNEKQKQAVTAPLGPVLVLAGAGSGKTRALAFRIAYLCEKKLVKPEHILAITFTNKAAKEMGERVKKILTPQLPTSNLQLPTSNLQPPTSNPQLPIMGTFHSVCARILRKEISRLGYTGSFTIYDTDDQLKVIREIIQDLHIDKRFGPSLFKAYISGAKNILQAPAEMSLGLEADLENLVREVYVRYQNFLFRQNSADFDDLLMLTVKIFQNFPDALEKYQKLFQYILVDEYQDTNHAQYVLLHLLAQKRHNLFVVGDDAQSIYGFRGSNIRNILNFEEDFPESKVIKLEQNYRSTRNILAAAQKVIEINPEQKQKTLWTENGEGAKVEVREVADELAEAQFVAKKIIDLSTGRADEDLDYEPEQDGLSGFSILDHFLRKAKKNQRGNFPFLPQLPKDHASLNGFAVLLRTHAQTRVLEEVFIESGIPYQIVGGVKFYERKEIKDVLAYLRLAANYRDLVSLKRVINEPSRGIGEKSFQVIRKIILDESLSVGAGTARPPGGKTISSPTLIDFRIKLSNASFGPKIGRAIDAFFEMLEVFASLDHSADLGGLLRLVIKRTNYEEWLKDGTENGEARWENVEELFNVVEKYKNLPWQESLQRFLEEVALITEIDELNETRDCVTLMTLHSAKGLEFDTVFLAGLEEGILPHSRSLLDPAELSEEIRLAYVGLTRAKQRLYLTYARARRAFGSVQYNQPSRILRALPKDKIIHKGSAAEETYYEREDGGEDELDF
ncbi:MAG: UvrD-helicase domain-containing protein [Patescibacteria group bacterium]|nr:UvrD-helicase domain-containing protein [Patescibacteria group bacterium]